MKTQLGMAIAMPKPDEWAVTRVEAHKLAPLKPEIVGDIKQKLLGTIVGTFNSYVSDETSHHPANLRPIKPTARLRVEERRLCCDLEVELVEPIAQLTWFNSSFNLGEWRRNCERVVDTAIKAWAAGRYGSEFTADEHTIEGRIH